MDERTVDRDELAKYLAQALDITRFRDYCPNGLQVEGRSKIARLVTGVTASVELIEAALSAGADAILVHHGYFWRGEDARVIGPKLRRLKLLLESDINLFAYQLPLDMQAKKGNNAQLAKRLDLVAYGRFGENELGWIGYPADAAMKSVGELSALNNKQQNRPPKDNEKPEQPNKRNGWCT